MLDTRPDNLRAASHAGCLAYGRTAIVLVFVANALAYYMGGDSAMIGMVIACLAMGAAYISQMMFNLADFGYVPGSEDYTSAYKIGTTAQWASIAAAVIAGLIALVMA